MSSFSPPPLASPFTTGTSASGSGSQPLTRPGSAPLLPTAPGTQPRLWIAQGANPVTIQRRMGHKDVRTTLQVYGHLLPEQDDMLTARMEDLRAEV